MDIESKIAVLDAEVSSVKAELAVVRSNLATKVDLATVKADLAAVKLDVAVIRATYITKEDLRKAFNTLTWKVYGFGTLLVAIVFFIAKYAN